MSARGAEAPASRTAASAQPAARNAGRGGRPDHVDLLHRPRPGATRATAAAIPGVRATRRMPLPSARTPAAIGGRLGPRRTDVLPGQQHPHRPAVLVGQPAGRRRRRRGQLGPEGAAVAERAGRLAAGAAPGAVELDVGGLDPGGPQGDRPRPRGNLERMADAGSAAPALDRLGGPAGLAERLADGPSPSPVAHRHEGVGRGQVVGEAAPPEGDVGTDLLGRAAFDGRPPAGGGQVPGRVGGREVHGGRRGRCANRCSGTGGPAGTGPPGPRRPGRRRRRRPGGR